jgi:hypothetical protein
MTNVTQLRARLERFPIQLEALEAYLGLLKIAPATMARFHAMKALPWLRDHVASATGFTSEEVQVACEEYVALGEMATQ